MNLAGQTAIITGASSGIGAGVARELSAAGMRLVITARREERIQALAAELGNAVCLTGDICDPALPQRLIDKALETYGRLDVVFNNAGVMEATSVEAANIDDICRMARINVEASYRLIYTTLQFFLKQGAGQLLNTSSILGTKVRPTLGAYAGTKFAMEALCEALRMELAGTDIRICCLEPGLVLTELHAKWEKHPMELFGIDKPLMPEDMARCARFILEQPAHVRIQRMLVMPGQQSL